MARKMKDSGIEWIGEIPEGWEVSQLKYATRWKSEKGCPDAPVLSLYRDFGVVPKDSRDDNHNVTSLDTSNYKVVDIGDLVINKMKAWQGSMAVSDYRGIVSPAYHVCSITSNKVNKRYLHHLLRNPAYLPEYARLSTGMRIGQWDLGFDDFKNIPFLIPPLDEQAKIADYLDNGCASLDAMLSKTRSSIEEYKKLKQAVITQAIATQHCSHIKLKYLMNVIVDCPHETPTYSFTGNYYVIRTADQALASLRCDEDMYRLDASEYKKRTRRLTLDKDDIVYGREGERWGLACIVPESNKYCLGQRIMQFRCNTKFLYPKYAMYALNSEPVYLQGVADTIGSTSPHVNISTVCNYLLPVPALTEQKEIVNYLDAKCAEIDRLIAKKEQLVKELESYKKSLIYEVVTGKREV